MDTAIYPYRLTACKRDIADGLSTDGRADKCGGCSKPFTVVRELKFIFRVTHIDTQGIQHAWSWPLCRKCARENLSGGSVHDELQRQAFDELFLLMATHGGAL